MDCTNDRNDKKGGEPVTHEMGKDYKAVLQPFTEISLLWQAIVLCFQSGKENEQDISKARMCILMAGLQNKTK